MTSRSHMDLHKNAMPHLFRISLAASLLFFGTLARAATVSPLFARGYTVLPSPQVVNLGRKDFEVTGAWRIEIGPGVESGDVAIQTLQSELQQRFQLQFSGPAHAANIVRLAIVPNTVSVTRATDKDKAALEQQAYRLDLEPDRVTITGNTTTGLFYGVQTLVQLPKRENGKLYLPEGRIEDWPDLELRVIYWDDAHHLEHLDVLKAALRQAAFYKINGFSIKLEGHFQYAHAKPIVEPYAFTPAELQELTDYGLRYHVQVIPYLDGPAHDAFILKHPEYTQLREFPNSNYEFCTTNPDTYQLFGGMIEDLLAANKGSKYFVLSTDEPYYVGLADNDQCHEAQRAKQLGSVGKLLAEFVTKTADYLHERGRTVIFWGEYPLKPSDIDALPAYLVNGELYGPSFDPVFRAHGIRQMIYVWTEGEEQLFPQYYVLPADRRLHRPRDQSAEGRVREMFEQTSFTSLASLSSVRPDSAKANQADVMGQFVAGWGDPGLHPETFWLGYVTGPAAAWHQGAPDPSEMENSFYRLFYGSGAMGMGKLYQLMSEQAQFWEDSWDIAASTARTPIFGNSYGVFSPPRPAHDQVLPLLPVPSAGSLHLGYSWHNENARRLELAGNFLAQNDSLIDLIDTDLPRVEFNRYNLTVYLSIADIYRQNLVMLQDLGRISDALEAAEGAAAKARPEQAVASLDRAIGIAENIRQERNQTLQNTIGTWYESWFPRVGEANGRRFLDAVDDVKDHQPVRTVDMSYLVYRELQYPLGQWAEQVIAVRNSYAAAHNLALRKGELEWKDTSTGVVTQRVADESDD